MNLDMLDANHSGLNLSKQHKNNESRGHSLKSGRIQSVVRRHGLGIIKEMRVV